MQTLTYTTTLGFPSRNIDVKKTKISRDWYMVKHHLGNLLRRLILPNSATSILAAFGITLIGSGVMV